MSKPAFRKRQVSSSPVQLFPLRQITPDIVGQINLVADMADRIRVNRLGQANYGNPAANNACDPQSGGGVDCTPDMMAAHDLFVWNQQVQQSLPNGAGLVQFNNGTNPPTFTIQVSWDEVGAGNLTHQVVLQVPNF